MPFGFQRTKGAIAGSDIPAELSLMRERVALQSLADPKGAGGFATETATTFASDVPAQVSVISGSAEFAAQDMRSIVTHEVRIRYRSDGANIGLILWGGVTLRVQGPALNRDARKRFLWLTCSQVAG